MTNITLSIPNDIYRLMRKYKEINWSEVARQAIIEKLLRLKSSKDGLTKEELSMLLEIKGMEMPREEHAAEKEWAFLRKTKEREKRRKRYLKELEKR